MKTYIQYLKEEEFKELKNNDIQVSYDFSNNSLQNFKNLLNMTTTQKYWYNVYDDRLTHVESHHTIALCDKPEYFGLNPDDPHLKDFKSSGNDFDSILLMDAFKLGWLRMIYDSSYALNFCSIPNLIQKFICQKSLEPSWMKFFAKGPNRYIYIDTVDFRRNHGGTTYVDAINDFDQLIKFSKKVLRPNYG